MKTEDFANVIRLARRAPLANMDEAEAAALLLQKFAAFANNYKGSNEPEQPNRSGFFEPKEVVNTTKTEKENDDGEAGNSVSKDPA